MPDTNEDHKTEDNQEAKNNVNGDDQPEESQETQDTVEVSSVDVDEVMDKDRGHTGTL
ncbi:hypothetical protein PG995_004866 [Apiospora arundinis]|uniref:Uncharacterized protein n=1 Tax=Apiospora arundinis TaxID=335852 RepID=A0ABR2IXS0_9PEZI